MKEGISGGRIASRIPLYLVVAIICIIWTVPTLGVLISSVRPPDAIQSTGWWTVFGNLFKEGQWTFSNYQRVLSSDGMGNAFLNSALVTIPSVVIPITIAAFAAYAFSWMSFAGRKLFFFIIIALMVVPLQLALLPILRLYTRSDLNGTYLGIWLAHTGFGLPLAIYLLYGHISSIPPEIIESAYVDGSTPMLTFTRLVLPLSIPIMASFAIFQFLWVWNDLLVALVFLGTKAEVTVVTSRLAALVGERGEAWHVLTAGAFVAMIVPLVVFFALQRYFVRGLTAGSVKG